MARQYILKSGVLSLTALLALLLCAGDARAQVAPDSTSTGAAANALTTFNWSHTIGSGTNRVLLVGVSLRADTGGGGAGGNTLVTGVTLGAAALTCVAAIADNNTGSCGSGGTGSPIFMRSELWALLNPASGAGTITVTTNNATNMAASAQSYAGVSSVTSAGTSATANGQTGVSTISLGPVSGPAGRLVVDNLAVARSAGNASTTSTQVTCTTAVPCVGVTGSGQTFLTNISDPVGSNGFGHVQSAGSRNNAATPTMTWAWNCTGKGSACAATSPAALVGAVLTAAGRHQFIISSNITPSRTSLPVAVVVSSLKHR